MAVNSRDSLLFIFVNQGENGWREIDKVILLYKVHNNARLTHTDTILRTVLVHETKLVLGLTSLVQANKRKVYRRTTLCCFVISGPILDGLQSFA